MQQWPRATIWISIGAIVVTTLIPSWRAAWYNSMHLYRELDWTMLTSPAFYLYGWFTLGAVVTPLGFVLRNLPLQRADDVRGRVLAGYLLATLGLSFFMTLFWQAAAWLSYPLLKDGQLRIIPLYPWPDSTFLGDFLHFGG